MLPPYTIRVILCLLGLDLAIFLDMDMVIGLQYADFVVREFNAVPFESACCTADCPLINTEWHT